MLKISEGSGPGCLSLLALCVWCGCSKDEAVLRPADLNPEAVGQQAVLQYDANGDKRIDATELKTSPGLVDAMASADQNKDGALTAEEIAIRVQFHADRKVALLPVRYAILLDGGPLEGATMTLVPEKFFQGGIPEATASSDAEGIVEPTMEFGDEYEVGTLTGVRPGIYRIEVSKKGADGRELLPARYNSKSELGREVGVGPHQHGPIISETRELNLSSR